ncbi:MAG: RsmB/NOP family class I SAM-dependent RNA methyltransferase [Lachnospiraceae bacterium]|nr:RsmB/NOP family class I SAM-dependent RNA methyltransferase [Lachnospiraceae bacterium]
MHRLPQEFLDRMKTQLGEEFDSFLACFDTEGYTGLRVNTGKVKVEEFLSGVPFHLTPVPWTTNGFYYDRESPVAKHPYYFAGLYYIQEPSAMLPASRLPVQPGDIVLDLCAAPGGKATELSSQLQGKGLLVANDASASRAKALVKNLALWGTANCCITGETPERLLEQFGCCFDKILVDAPCSGEGMFRKDSGLIESWKSRGPESYAPVQKDILDCAVQMLKPGGVLAYSTCTFSSEEDEEVISEILRRYPDMEPVQPEMAEGFAAGTAPCGQSIRIWPQRVKGEGHFLALLRKRGRKETEGAKKQAEPAYHREECTLAAYSAPEIQKNHRKIPEQVTDFLVKLPGVLWENTVYEQIGEQCLLLPPYHLPKHLRYLRTGIMLGTLKRGRFEPSQALAMLLDRHSFPCVLDLSAADERTIRYLKGETLELTAGEDAGLEKTGKCMTPGTKGWVLICVDGFALGWGKYVKGTIKNKYYPGWRLQ